MLLLNTNIIMEMLKNMAHTKNKETLMQMTENTICLHAKIGRLDVDRETKEELYRLLGDFSGKITEVMKENG